MRIVQLLLLVAVLTGSAFAADAEGADPLGVAAVLLRDGNLEKAAALLASVDPRSAGIDLVRYHSLRGILALRKADFPSAEASLRAAKAAGQKDPSIDAYLAQALYSQKKWAETLALIEGFNRINSFPDLYGMRSQAEWNLDKKSEAVLTLDKAISFFPSRFSFQYQKIGYLLELNLSQAAADQARDLLGKAEKDPGVHLTVGEALRRSGQPALALPVLETARLRFPENLKLKLALGQAYADLGMTATAARLVEEVGIRDAKYLGDAAELYRRAKDYPRALYWNSLVADPKAKAQQRFSILLDSNRFEEALALKDRMERLGLLTEDRWKYAVAFASYRVQQFDAAQGLLTGISDSGWFNRAVQLRRAIEVARAEETPYF